MSGARQRTAMARAVLALLALVALPAAARARDAVAGDEAATVASAALIGDAGSWDSRAVAFAGEAIGEPMYRGSHAWIQLNDDRYLPRAPIEAVRPRHGYNSGLAAWVPARQARGVRLFGGYGSRGDLVRVLGTFHAACPEHGGDMDIHVASLRVVEEGYAVKRPVSVFRLALGLGLLALAGALERLRRRLAARPAVASGRPA